MNHDDDMRHAVAFPATVEELAALPAGTTCASAIGVPRGIPAIVLEAMDTRSTRGFFRTWAGPGATLWTCCTLDRTDPETCEACGGPYPPAVTSRDGDACSGCGANLTD